ncbi:MAG: hypothetical protein ACRDZT_07925 [Acidimicrobiales bacterium]
MSQTNDPIRLPSALPSTGIPVEAFNPLLRSLLSWDLVRREEDADGVRHWVLIDAAQDRLDHLAPRPRRSTASLAYLDHWCARCRQQRLTHLRDGRYVCEDCERIESGVEPSAPPRPKRAHRGTEWDSSRD